MNLLDFDIVPAATKNKFDIMARGPTLPCSILQYPAAEKNYKKSIGNFDVRNSVELNRGIDQLIQSRRNDVGSITVQVSRQQAPRFPLLGGQFRDRNLSLDDMRNLRHSLQKYPLTLLR